MEIFTRWLNDEGVFACDGCGAWKPGDGEIEGHNRGCPHAWRSDASRFARERLRDLPEGKQALYMAVDGVVVVVAKDEAAHDLWHEWFKPRAIATFIGDVRAAAAEYPGHQHHRASNGTQA